MKTATEIAMKYDTLTRLEAAAIESERAVWNRRMREDALRLYQMPLRQKGGVMDSRFVEKKLVELYPTAAHYVIMQEFTGLRTAECCTRINEARFMLVLQDPDAALALAREYKEWKDKQKED